MKHDDWFQVRRMAARIALPALLLAALVVMALSFRAAEAPSSFLADAGAKAAAATKAGSTVITGKDGWLFFPQELRHLGAGKFWGSEAAKASQATNPDHADPLPVILDFKAQLDKAGLELWLVPVPAKAVVYPEFLADTAPGTARLDAQHQAFFETLRTSGVKVIDLLPGFLDPAVRKTNVLYCKQDTHWSGQGAVLAAQLIAKELKARPWFATLKMQRFDTEWRNTELNGDLWREVKPTPPAKETIPLRFVGTKSGSTLKPVAPDQASPVVLLGDSHNLIFHAGDDMQATGAGLPDQLAAELGFAVDLVAVRGSGATPSRINLLRRARGKPEYLAGKKAVVWCFTVREFTEGSGWQKVPVVK